MADASVMKPSPQFIALPSCPLPSIRKSVVLLTCKQDHQLSHEKGLSLVMLKNDTTSIRGHVAHLRNQQNLLAAVTEYPSCQSGNESVVNVGLLFLVKIQLPCTWRP